MIKILNPFQKFVMPAKAGIRLFILTCQTPAYAGVTVLLFLFPAHAEEPSTYAPDHCEFSVTFPDKPYKVRRCDDGDERCYDLVSYTKVFELSSTVNFRVICNPVGEELRESYDGKIMQATLEAMTDEKVIKKFDTSFREEEHYKQAGLVGEGKVGRTPTLYIAQLWIGDKSALSVEAELIGEAGVEADTLFSEVLKSVHYVEEKPEKEEAEKTEETEELKNE